MADILFEIIEFKRQEISDKKTKTSLQELKKCIAQAPKIRDFVSAINEKHGNKENAVIAEIKKASPSKGIIREEFDPIAIAKTYEKAGAACLSVLTDEKYFHGKDAYLPAVRTNCNLPILRKDFMLEPYQIYESRLLGADCILLIVAALNRAKMIELHDCAVALGMAVLVEVHNEDELKLALELPTPLIGINNRNLRTFTTDIATTLQLQKLIPKDKIIVTESGINTREDIALLRKNGIYTFLVGESFMRSADPGEKLQQLFFSNQQG